MQRYEKYTCRPNLFKNYFKIKRREPVFSEIRKKVGEKLVKQK
jgi:hypothetical protein